MSDQWPANVHCMAVPDGGAHDSARRRVTLNLSAVAWPRSAAAGGGHVDLAKWPSQVAAAAARFHVKLFDKHGAATHSLSFPVDPKSQDPAADTVWTQIVGGTLEDQIGFQVLYDVLMAAQTSSLPKPQTATKADQLQAGHKDAPTWLKSQVTEYAYSTLADQLSQLHVREVVADALTAIGSQVTAVRSTILGAIAAAQDSDSAMKRAATSRLDHPLKRDWRLDLWRNTYSGALFGMRPLGDAAGAYTTVLNLQHSSTSATRPAEQTFAAALAALPANFAGVQDQRLGALANPAPVLKAMDQKAGGGPPSEDHFLRKSTTLFDTKPQAGGTFASLMMLNLGAGSVQAPGRELFGLNLAAMHQALDRRITRPAPPPGGDEKTPTAQERAADLMRRKLAALESQPTLRKLLNLIIDLKLELTIDELGQYFSQGPDSRFYGQIAIAFDPDGSAANLDFGSRTAVIVRPVAGQGCLFEPAPEAEILGGLGLKAAGGRPMLKDGVVQLRGGRYRLETMDAVSSALKWQAAANATLELDRQGLSPGDISTAPPDISTRGVMLLDLLTGRDATTRLLESTGPAAPLLYAEDLIAGYRVDVLYEQAPQPFSATQRRIDFPDLKFPDWRDNEVLRRRDEGFVVVQPRQDPSVDPNDASKATTAVMASEVMFTWSGENLGVPGMQIDEHGVAITTVTTQDGDIPVTTVYALDGLSPVLRVGMGMRLGLRVRKPNGASIALEAAQALYEAHALGVDDQGQNGADKAFVYSLTERTRAPDVLVPLEGSFVSEGMKAHPGEADVVMVVRSGAVLPRREAKRVLLPSRASFDKAEQYGMFDDDNDDTPAGAFLRVALDKAGHYEVFPKAAAGTTQARSTVNVFRTTNFDAGERDNPFYPDPAARRLGVAITRDGQTLRSFSGQAPDLKFWDDDPMDAAPIYLRVRGKDGEGGSFARSDDGQGEVRGQQLDVELGAAEEVDLHLWTYASFETTRRQQRFADQAFSQLETQVKGSLADHWADSAHRAPVPSLQDQLKIRLVHALDKPRVAPAFVSPLTPIPISGAANGPGSLSGLRQAQGHGAPLAATPGPAAAVVHFSGKLAFDRPATEKVRIELRWLEFDKDLGTQPAATGDKPPEGGWPSEYPGKPHWTFKPGRGGHHLKVDPIARRDDLAAGDPGHLDLDLDDLGQLRSIAHTFPSAHARRLVVRNVGVSRFTPYLPPVAEPTEDGPEGAYERESVSVADCRAQLLNPGLSSAPQVWIPASAPPPAPVRAQPAHATQVQEEQIPGGVRAIWTSPIRVPLKDWPVSEGLLAGLICTPPDLFDLRAPVYDAARPQRYREQIPNLTRAEEAVRDRLLALDDLTSFHLLPKWLSDVVTQWGMDPTTDSPTRAHITPDRFSGYVATARNLQLNKGAPSGDDPGEADATCAPEAVAVVAYEPLFDAATGEWYCDVHLDPGEAHSPLVRFGLVRYQPHALPGCELSSAVGLDTIAVPARRIVELTRRDGEIHAVVNGVAFRDRAPAIARDQPITGEGLTKLLGAVTPVMRFTLLRHTANGPVQVGQPIKSASAVDTWTALFRVADWPEKTRFSVFIEEFVLDGLAMAGHRGQADDTLVERKLHFTYQGDV